MEEAIGMVPQEDKQAYLEALQKAPIVCETETDPLKFLRRCDYNVWEAAERICLYWKERKNLFQERAFLPLTLTGDGALTRDDTLNLRAGYPAVLPDTSTGRKVLLVDRRQIFPSSTIESRLRCFFYAANVMSEDERSQTEGHLLLILLAMPRFQDFDRQYVKRLIFLARRVFPVKAKKLLLNCPTTANKRHAVQDLLTSAIGILMTSGVNQEEIEVYFERGQGEMLAVLKETGLKEEGVPTFLGGTWAFMRAAEWCRARAQQEREEHKWALAVARQKQNAVPDGKDQRAKKRERNLIYSRRKRDRRRQENSNLQQQHQQLVAENTLLRAEESRLEGLLGEAQRLVASLQAEDGPD